jgi:hypothetical protein
VTTFLGRHDYDSLLFEGPEPLPFKLLLQAGKKTGEPSLRGDRPRVARTPP